MGQSSTEQQAEILKLHLMKIILIDGVCKTCQASVRFIFKRDKVKQFFYCTQHSERGRQLMEQCQLSHLNLQTIIYLNHGQALTHSTAVLSILSDLGGIYLFYAEILKLIPQRIRDWLYQGFANHRYQLFGQYSTCPIPEPSLKKQFLD